MSRRIFHRRRRKRAYTLIELLVVMGIMALLLAVLVPAIAGLNESYNIASGGQSLSDQITLARQIASSRNITVEVRCLKLLPLPAPPAGGYNGILLWSPNLGAPVSRLVRLPDGVAISQDTTAFSTLFSSYTDTGTMILKSGTTTYVGFTINPTGMVGPLPASGTAPSMTSTVAAVLPARLATATTLASAKNYALVQVNPITAATIIYRP